MNEIFLSLVGSLVTLVAAFIGFWGVIYSQRKLMKMAEDERAHQEQLTRDQATEDRKLQLRSFINALLGEIAALKVAFGSAGRLLAAQVGIAEQLARGPAGRQTQPRISFRFLTPVFDSHVGRIGLLDPNLSFAVTNFYGQVLAFSSQDQSQVPEMDPALAINVMRAVEANLKSLGTQAELIERELKTAADTAIL